ncbi:MAG: lactate racemization operon protein LarA, partial [Angelakisella sp.]
AIASPYAAAGVLRHNPIHEDMEAAARAVNVQFTFNVALDGNKKVVAAFAGDLVESHLKGAEFIREMSQCPSITGDIVITSNGGYPLDQNLYQSPKAVGTHFAKLITMGSIEEIDAYLSKIPPKETIPEQWCPQIYSRILRNHKVILVTTYLSPEEVRKANMIPASSPDEALELAYAMKGKDAKVVVIPDGVSVLAVKD